MRAALVTGRRRSAVAATSNLLSNPGAESGTTGWVGQAATLATVTTPVRSGANAFRLTTTTAGNVEINNSAFVAVTAGTSYTYSAWFRSAATPRSASIRVDWYNSIGNYVATSTYAANITTSTTAWTQASFKEAAPTGITQAVIIPVVGSTVLNEVHYIDDIVLSTP